MSKRRWSRTTRFGDYKVGLAELKWHEHECECRHEDESKMHEEIVISGFGGQGVLFAGQLLAYAGVADGRHVTWIPSYGPEMRGGTAHCKVVISSEEIGSPLMRTPPPRSYSIHHRWRSMSR